MNHITVWLETSPDAYPTAVLSRVMGVSEGERTDGSKRLQSELSDHGVVTCIDRIKRIFRKLGLRCKQKRKFMVTTDSRHSLPLSPNLLNRQFDVEAPNRVLATDITCMPTDDGWLYLAGTKDLKPRGRDG